MEGPAPSGKGGPESSQHRNASTTRRIAGDQAVRWIGFEPVEPRVEPETRCAVGIGNHASPPHIEIDMGVVVGWGDADAKEDFDADADFRNAIVVSEPRI